MYATSLQSSSIPYERTVLPNGLRIITAAMPHTRSAAVYLFIGVGARYEPSRLSGISHYLEHMVFKGTLSRPDPVQISQAIEGVGGSLNAGTDQETTSYSALVPHTHVQTALDVLADMVLRPELNPEEVERERDVILEELRGTNDAPAELNDLLFDSLIWGDHPLGRDVAGSIRTVRRISRDDLASHAADYYSPSNVVVSVAGNVTHSQIVREVEALWGRAPSSPRGAGSMQPPLGSGTGPHVGIKRKRTAQVNLMLGVPALPYTDPRRFAQDVLDAMLGGGMSSRLFVELRENLGLAYTVSSFVRAYCDTGAFGVHAAVDGERVLPAVAAILQELARIASVPPGETELRKVKEYMKGHTLLSLERSSYVASWGGWQELMLGRIESVDEVLVRTEAISAEDVSALASELFRPERLSLALVGPFADPEPYRAALGAWPA